MRRVLLGVIASVAIVASASPARAQADQTEQAKALFLAGAAAYEKHDFVGAIRAFEGAQQLAPRPANLFSLAQAHRRQFYVDGNATHQRAAVDLFREYVKQVPSGGRHEDAMRALQELGALATQQEVASVSINSSGTPHARVTLDGAPPVDAPLIGPVSAGKHHAVISADGYASEERDVTAVNGQIVALDVPLKEKPARVIVNAPSGAAVVIDGRPAGETPLAGPLDVAAGPHVIAISKNGHEAYVRDVELARGEQRRFDAPLPASKQRTVAIGLLVASGVTIVGAATCTAFAAYYLGVANGVLDKQRTQGIQATDVATYDDARTNRGDFLIAAGISFGVAAVLAGTGLALFVFDKPQTTSSTPRERTNKPTERKTEPADLSFAPLVSPTTVGASALLRF